MALVLGLMTLISRCVLAEDKSQQPCQNATTQAEINLCMGEVYKKADRELNQLYVELKKRVSLASLQVAQRAWVKYRNTNCAVAAEQYEGGSAQPAVKLDCLARNTRARIDELHAVYPY